MLPDSDSLRVLVVGDRGDDDAGFVGERLTMLGARLVALDRDDLPAYPPDADLLVLLGSARSGHASDQGGVVERESTFVCAALDDGVPVLGICYGAQLLAHALGGTITRSPCPEVGFFELESYDGELCPVGPWAQMHSDAFVPPSTARELGRSTSGSQGFADESRGARALAWQFHPEVTPDEYVRWLGSLEDYAREHGADPDRLREQAYQQEERLRAAAHRLTDSALSWLRVMCPDDSPTSVGS